jgi:hypothetical protein
MELAMRGARRPRSYTTDHDEIRGMGRVRSRRRIAARTQAYTWCFLLHPMPMTTPRGDLVDKFFHKFNDADLALLYQNQTSPANRSL